jgi:hypothetical protein
MKFYREKDSLHYWLKIRSNNLDAIYYDNGSWFFKNGEIHNYKNAAYKNNNDYKEFALNGVIHFCCYGNSFTKESWRRYVKLQVFL